MTNKISKLPEQTEWAQAEARIKERALQYVQDPELDAYALSALSARLPKIPFVAMKVLSKFFGGGAREEGLIPCRPQPTSWLYHLWSSKW